MRKIKKKLSPIKNKKNRVQLISSITRSKGKNMSSAILVGGMRSYVS